jgi:tRNA(Ile)-lysidine synthase
MNLIEQVGASIDRHQLLPPNRRVLVGVSGGVDSVVLLHLLHQLEIDLLAVHVNYRLRGEEADADEELVQSLCKALGVPLFVERYDTKSIAEAQGLSVQETARDLRYDLFADIAEKEGLQAVAVAHHLNDQAETVLLNLFRGAGPEGMAGMPVKRSIAPGSEIHIIRPLLGIKRSTLEAYAIAEKLSWSDDATNTSPDYTRSAIRTVILPAIEAHFGSGVRESIVRAGDLMREYVDDFFRPAVDRAWEQCARSNNDGGHRNMLDLACLKEYPPVMRRRLILEAMKRWLPEAHYSSALAEEIEHLTHAQTGKRVEVGKGVVLRDRTALIFSTDLVNDLQAEPDEQEVRIGDTLTTLEGTLRTEVLAVPPESLDPGTHLVCYADADHIAEPLTLRPWRPGDRFHPLGFPHEKKISDYLTNVKVPPDQRSHTLVLCAADQIVWLVGHRMSEDVKVGPETKRIAKLTFEPA